MNDMARLLGALYRAGDAKKIVFDGKTYTCLLYTAGDGGGAVGQLAALVLGSVERDGLILLAVTVDLAQGLLGKSSEDIDAYFDSL